MYLVELMEKQNNRKNEVGINLQLCPLVTHLKNNNCIHLKKKKKSTSLDPTKKIFKVVGKSQGQFHPTKLSCSPLYFLSNLD